MDAEGVAFEILFPQTLIGFVRYPDLEIQENMYRVYNEYTNGRLPKGFDNDKAVNDLAHWLIQQIPEE